jgi:hypothetical protein
MEKPQITGRVSAQNLDVQGSQWKSAELSLQADRSRIVVSNGSLTSAQRGKDSFGAAIELRDWSYMPSNRIQANLSLRQMPAFARSAANVQYQ